MLPARYDDDDDDDAIDIRLYLCSFSHYFYQTPIFNFFKMYLISTLINYSTSEKIFSVYFSMELLLLI